MRLPDFKRNLGLLLIATPLLFLNSSCNNSILCEKGKGELVQETRYPSDFSSVRLMLDADMDIVIDTTLTESELILSAQENFLEDLQTPVKGGTLMIFNDDCYANRKKLTVKLYTPSLNGVHLDGSGHIASIGLLTGDEVQIGITGSGKINTRVRATKTEITIEGSGDIQVGGDSDDISPKITGSGNIKAFDLQSKNAEAKIDGSGEIEISVSQHLDARITGSGTIWYKGFPSVDSDISGSGRVARKD